MSHNYRLVAKIKSKGPGRGLEKKRKTALLGCTEIPENKKGITGRDRDVHPKVVSLNDFSAVIINKANIRKAGINDE